MSTPVTSETLPFANKGIHLDRSSSELGPGEYSELTNLVSTQEGSLSVRAGNQRLTGPASFGGGPASGVIHSLAKLRVSDDETQNKYYAGVSDVVYRANGPLPAAGAGMGFATGVALAADIAADYTKQRFGAVQHNSGTVGAPSEYLACPLKMLTDSQGQFTQWGIFPPTRPVIAALDALTYIDDTASPDHHKDLVRRSGGGSPVATNDRIPASTVSSIVGTAPGQLTITPSSMAQIIQGMMVQIGANINVRVESVTPTAFVVYSDTLPGVGNAIVGWRATQSGLPALPAGSLMSVIGIPILLDCSFGGDPVDGYETDDIVHIGVNISDPSKVQELRIKCYANPISGLNYTDWYEKAISINSLQDFSSTLPSPAIDTLQGQVPDVSQGIIGDFEIPSDQSQQTKPAELGLFPPQAQVIPVWTEIDIPKTQFVKVGNAGTGVYTWKNISLITVEVTCPHDNDQPTIQVSSIYIAGGFGPNGRSTPNTIPRQPYKYLYTYRDPVNNHPGNPCVEMVDSNAIQPQRQKVRLTLRGTGDFPHIPTTGNAPSIAVYRSGGLFADALYRLIGYTTNPGAGADVVFYDTQDDSAIEGADVIEFDNDPPIVSDLPVPYRFGNIVYTAGSGAAGASSTWKNAVLSGPAVIGTVLLKPGNVITVDLGTPSEEKVVVEVISQTILGGIQITAYFQNPHPFTASMATSSFVSADAISGGPANLVCSAFDSLFVAGDIYNPHKLYQSKVGQPESFPVIEQATGIPKIINVGSPSNPIVGITEANGVIISLNLSAIYIIPLFGGAMQTPVRTPAQRGCVGNGAWCKAINEIWYMATDGIYSWAGGQSSKRSQQLEPLFRGITVGNYLPFDISQLYKSTFVYYRNQVKITYINTSGDTQRIVYDLMYQRWLWEQVKDPLGNSPVTTQYVEEDTNRLLICKMIGASSYLYLDDVGTSDGWVNAQSDGLAISYAATGPAFTGGRPQIQKQFTDRILEMQNDQDSVTVQAFYDFLATADISDSIVFAPPATPTGRRRVPQTFHAPFGFEAYAVQFRYSGSTRSIVKLFTDTFTFFSLTQAQIGRAFDWDDLGTPDDKRLYEVTIWYDAKTSPRLWTLDVIQGIGNQQVVTEAVQDFILQPLQGTFHTPAWTQVTFPINDTLVTAAGIPNSIVKKIRLRPK